MTYPVSILRTDPFLADDWRRRRWRKATAPTDDDSGDARRQRWLKATGGAVARGMESVKTMKKTLMTRDAPNVRNMHPKPWRWRVPLLLHWSYIMKMLLQLMNRSASGING